MTIPEALALLRVNPPHPESPLPWRVHGPDLCDANDESVAECQYAVNPGHIAAAVNAAPVLAAEVERLQSMVATGDRLRAEDAMELLRCQSAMREWQELSTRADDREVTARKEVERLTALLAAARVAVEELPEYYHEASCGIECGHKDCDCPAEYGETKRTAARRAVGLEENHG